MNQSHGRDIQPAQAWPAWSSPVSAPTVFICAMSARLLVLHAIEPLRNKGARAGAQDAQGFAEEGFINEPLLFGRLQREDGSSCTRREAWAVAQNKYSLCCLKHFACGWSLASEEKMKSGLILLLHFWDDGNEVRPHVLHVEISLLKISSRTFPEGLFWTGVLQAGTEKHIQYTFVLPVYSVPALF